MTALRQDHDQGSSAPATLEYRPMAADRVDDREHVIGALRSIGLLVGMLVCVTAFLFLAIIGLGMMVMAVSGLGWMGLGVLCMMLGLGALFLAGWCLDAMQ